MFSYIFYKPRPTILGPLDSLNLQWFGPNLDWIRSRQNLPHSLPKHFHQSLFTRVLQPSISFSKSFVLMSNVLASNALACYIAGLTDECTVVGSISIRGSKLLLPRL